MKLFIATFLVRMLTWISPETLELYRWDGCINGRFGLQNRNLLYDYEIKYTEFICNSLYPAFDKKDDNK